MNIQLIQGEFSSNEAWDLLSQMIQVKIKFHESKIEKHASEEDIKQREEKIKYLQNQLKEARAFFMSQGQSVKINADIKIH
jgi:hypothetical protein